MNISQDLKRLAQLFPAPLYVVGGAVRDFLIGKEVHDYDLTSPLPADKVVALLSETEFKTTPHSLRLGTIGIKVGDMVMEYTAFRKDSYAKDGGHLPQKVEFNCTQIEDAERRDFTINAIYYDVIKEEIVDPLGGLEDIKNKIIRTTRRPDDVMEEDALRILRLVRFSSSLGYDIEDKTYNSAKRRAYTLGEIAKERIREEFEKILVADTVCGIKDAQIRGIELMVELGIMKEVVPEMLESLSVKQNAKYHAYDVYHHVLETVKLVPPHLRLVAFLHDVGKPRSIDNKGHMRAHASVGASMARGILTRLRYPKKDIGRVVKLISTHMFNTKCDCSIEDVRVFILENQGIIDDYCILKQADFIAHGKESGISPSVQVVKDTREDMVKNGTAFNLKELPIEGRDLIVLGVEPSKRGVCLKGLLDYGARQGRALSREECIQYVKRIKF